ncbi:MAG: PASTA domain-containing protein [Bacteroidetes bacterium]|nr:PASTA domain-containing protein [Bacteroidota bacterium]MDA0950229.1 PASTA domain-containing protein [Bacteroidota bacterium]
MKRLISFFTSRIFWIQLGLAALLVFLLVGLTGWRLSSYTQHNQEVSVPDLSAKSLEEVADALNALSLRYEVYDTIAFSADFQPFAVREQNPKPFEKVKSNRKIYLVINRGDYERIALPEVIQSTERNARTKLATLGLKVNDSAEYIDAIGRNMVYEVRLGKAPVQTGALLGQNDVLTLVLGNGKDSIE